MEQIMIGNWVYVHTNVTAYSMTHSLDFVGICEFVN